MNAEPMLGTAPLELQPHLVMPPRIDATEGFLRRLFLRRYITWCARRGRFKQMQGAARLHKQITTGSARMWTSDDAIQR